jgi:hypothetical protein
MNLAIVGWRHFRDYEIFASEMLKVLDDWGIPDLVVSGGAPGADTLAARWSIDCDIPLKVFDAQWGLYGRSAGPRRNTQIVDLATHLIAFVHPTSRGTWDSVNKAKKKGITYRVVNITKCSTHEKGITAEHCPITCDKDIGGAKHVCYTGYCIYCDTVMP